VSVSAPYVIPSTPPTELLAELDAAAAALDRLTARAAELTLQMDEQVHRLRIGLQDDRGPRTLTPTELFGLLATS
jgi:GAF domain-containing protein